MKIEEQYPYQANIKLNGHMREYYPFELGEAWTGAFEADFERGYVKDRINHALHLAGTEDYKVFEGNEGFTLRFKSHGERTAFYIAIRPDDKFLEQMHFDLQDPNKTPEDLEKMHQKFNAMIANHGLEDICSAEPEQDIEPDTGESDPYITVTMHGKAGYFGFLRALEQNAEQLQL